jgi:hypothetical protein
MPGFAAKDAAQKGCHRALPPSLLLAFVVVAVHSFIVLSRAASATAACASPPSLCLVRRRPVAPITARRAVALSASCCLLAIGAVPPAPTLSPPQCIVLVRFRRR